MKNIRRFTLVELLAAIAIIAILSAIGFGSYSYAMNKARESSTEALLKQLTAGVETLRSKYGFYPPSNQFRQIAIEIDASSGAIEEIIFGYDGGSEFKLRERAGDKAIADFLRVAEGEQLKQRLPRQISESGGIGVLEDAWGGKIHYRAPGKYNTAGFDLVSAGADGVFSSDGKEDGNSLESVSISKYRDDDGDWICDDIANF